MPNIVCKDKFLPVYYNSSLFSYIKIFKIINFFNSKIFHFKIFLKTFMKMESNWVELELQS